MYEHTMTDIDGRVAKVITRPRKQSAHEYRFHHTGEAWVLSRERAWYTEHALQYAEQELDGEVVRRHVPVEQSTLDDFYGDRSSDSEEVESASTTTAAD